MEIEDGHPVLDDDPHHRARGCAAVAGALVQIREEYEARFGHQDLASIPVRVRAVDDLRTVGVEGRYAVSGHAYADAIDLGQSAIEAFPHELNHVRTGPSHDGWCVDYEPWSELVLGVNQRGYLGCE